MIKLQANKLLGERTYWWLSATTQINYSIIRNATHKRNG